MSKIGARNAITDVAGLRIGMAEDAAIRTGVTVILPDARAVAAVDVQGGGTGTRELELLRADATLEAVDAIILGGGSAFGLSAADGVMGWLAEQGRGFPVGDLHVPIVPGAILFDLLNGGEKSAFKNAPDTALPYRTLARAAAESAGLNVPLGNAGAGFGATTTGRRAKAQGRAGDGVCRPGRWCVCRGTGCGECPRGGDRERRGPVPGRCARAERRIRRDGRRGVHRGAGSSAR